MSIFNKLTMLVLALTISTIVNSNIIGNDFQGKWCADKINEIDGFTLIIRKTSNSYIGSYLTVAYKGEKIDDVENAFSFKAFDKNSIKTKLKSGTSDKLGTIQLKILSNNKLKWRILKIPGGEFYAPQNATMYKCN